MLFDYRISTITINLEVTIYLYKINIKEKLLTSHDMIVSRRGQTAPVKIHFSVVAMVIRSFII